MSELLSILLTLALAGVLIYIIARNQHPTQTLAWVLVIIFLPVVGLILYFLVGRRPSRKRLLPAHELDILKQRVCDAQGEYRNEAREDFPGVSRLVAQTNQSLPLAGNDVKVYVSFFPMLDDLVADLEQARDHIHFEFFKFEDDPCGRRVADVLMRKAREGVVVRVQYDDLANLWRKKFYRELKAAGVQVEPFIALTFPVLSADTNFRNHRKVVVIDGKVGYMGGMNIAERYGKGLSWGPWRDTHLRLEGPVVAEMQVAFLSDWRFSSKELLAATRYFPCCGAKGERLVQLLASGPMDEWHVAMQGFVQLLATARDYVYVQSPYFVPTPEVMLALKNAALAGTDVRVMIPRRGDGGPLVPLASKSYLSEVLASGVKIYFYDKGFLHAKTIVADDCFASVGSTNVDVRSYHLDFEIDAYMYDTAMAAQLKEAFLRDMADATLVTPEAWAQRPRFEKFKESLARLFSPLL